MKFAMTVLFIAGLATILVFSVTLTGYIADRSTEWLMASKVSANPNDPAWVYVQTHDCKRTYHYAAHDSWWGDHVRHLEASDEYQCGHVTGIYVKESLAEEKTTSPHTDGDCSPAVVGDSVTITTDCKPPKLPRY